MLPFQKPRTTCTSSRTPIRDPDLCKKVFKPMKCFYVYIMCSKRNGTLYLGVTNDLARRVFEHKNKKNPGFTAKYSVAHLIYFETFNSITTAIQREKQLKNWTRSWKLQLIEKANPEWKDLYTTEE